MEEHDNIEEINEEETPKKKSNTAALVVLIICLALSLGGNALLFFKWGEANKTLTAMTAQDSAVAELQAEITGLEEEVLAHKAIAGRMDDSFSYERAELLAQIADLEDQLSRARAAIYHGDAAQLARVKKELQQVKADNELLGQRLEEAKDKISIEEEKNAEYLTSLEAAGRQADSLIKAKEKLQEKVKKASDIKLSSTIAIPSRDKRGTDEQEDKARRVEKIVFELVTLENDLAESGKKELFVIITGPGKIILSNDNPSLTDKSKLYSLKKTIDYDGSEQKIKLTYTQKAEYKPGSYSVRVIIDGNLAGRTDFTLR